jgi:hypothetical protein
MTKDAIIAKSKIDKNMTGLAGELFVAAELLKREFQTSITFGNAKQIDLLAHNPRTGLKFAIQVKSLRYKNYFPVREINENLTYVFVVLNKPEEAVRYFIASAKEIFKHHYKDPKGFSGFTFNSLLQFENKWDVFEREL